MNCMADGARGGIQTVDAIEACMASAPRYPRPRELAAVETVAAEGFSIID
jgi:hypothetical protein